MNTGQVISGAGHAGLIAWAVLGGAFQSEPLPFEVTEVTAVSVEEYAALIARSQSPEAVANIDTPEPPEAGEAPELNSTADTPPEVTAPQVADAPSADTAPDLAEVAPPSDTEVSDEPPVLQPPSEDVAALVPELTTRPQPRPAPRVAPEPVAQPEPDTQVDEVEQPETTPDEAAETPREDTEATAPEEAATEIVTEAEQAAKAAPSSSLRPKSRPTRTAPDEAETEPETDDTAVNAALAEALGQTDSSSNDTPQGPPLTSGEKDALRVAVQQCWNVGSLSSDALQTTVVVAVTMTEDARPVTSSIRMMGSTGGSNAAAKQAFEAARRAIIRCGASGYNLPIEKYDSWREIEMTFNPEKMRIK